jgi:DNA-binding transcriptional LysR family regulator
MDMQQIYQGMNGSVSCGILNDFTLNGIMQENFHTFLHKHPDYTINLERGSFKNLLNGLISGKYDCIISFFFALDNVVSLNYKIIEDIQEGILISSKNPLAKKKYFDPKDFKNHTFIAISSEDNSYASKGPVEFCQKYGFYPRLRFAPNPDTAALWVEAGMGIAFTYNKSVGSYNPAMTFLPLKEGEIMTSAPMVVLAWNENNTNPAALRFINEFHGKHS